jgi:beta-glucosidase
MNSFNDLNGTPATGNSYLLRDVLKGQWHFSGFVVSDWGSVGEMIPHGYVANREEAAQVALTAGCDMDMESRSYTTSLSSLVQQGKIPMTLIDDAVKRILRKKFELGLFDDPYRFSNADREKTTLNKVEHIRAARDIADKSIVLLKNEGHLLPLSTQLRSIALIGPLVHSKKEMKGFWSLDIGAEKDIVSLYEGVQQQAGAAHLLYAKGCDITDTSRAGFTEAIQTALQADVVVMAMGERADMTGEAKSRADIHLPGVQEELIKAIRATGRPVVVLLMAGRPMIFNWTAENIPAILYTWWLGNQAGNAMADVLFGRYNPSAKLPVSFPREMGQIPIYYNHLNTGRPAKDEKDVNYVSAYTDLYNTPRYAFGYGLSYTDFKYANLSLSKKSLRQNESVTVTFDVRNIGRYTGEETIQLYLRDVVSQPLRPVEELKDFAKVKLAPGETKKISFTIDRSKLAFYNDRLELITQPGEFQLFIGSASDDIRLQDSIQLVD